MEGCRVGIQVGEVGRRWVFNVVDAFRGGKLRRLKEVNKREIVDGVTDDYVNRRIEKLLYYAKENSEFYKEQRELEKLSDFPVMDKGDYIKHYDEVLCDGYEDGQQGEFHRRWKRGCSGGRKVYSLSTSGSTGTPFMVVCDGDKMNRINMNFISCMELNGFRLGMKRGEFRVWIPGKNAVTPLKSMKNNLIMIDISNMGDESLKGICKTIGEKRIQVLVSYSSALGALARYIVKEGIDVSKWEVEMVFSMGEALADGTFDLLKGIFGFAPVRSYGNNENGFIAIQLNEEQDYTVDLYNYYVEILKLDSDEKAGAGEVGRIVVTDYYNKAFPMIRYDTGDTGIMEMYYDGKGRRHAKFKEIYGRRGSLMYNCQGEPLSIHVFMNILIGLEGIVYQAKCIQWEKTRYEVLLNGDREKIDEEEVVASYRNYLGEEAVIDVTYVDEIPVQASGKWMACENRCLDYR